MNIVYRAQVVSLHAEQVTNIGELFAALAVGWQAGSQNNRLLVAGDGGQFIRVDPMRHLYPYYAAWPGDILVNSGGYGLRGFVKFEARDSLLRDLFTTAQAGDGAWYSAKLTARGFELAQIGLLPDLAMLKHPFFNPRTSDVERELQLGRTLPRLAGPTEEGQS